MANNLYTEEYLINQVMANKQTPIEWLLEKLKNQGSLNDLNIEAAKQMENEQNKKIWRAGYQSGMYQTLEHIRK